MYYIELGFCILNKLVQTSYSEMHCILFIILQDYSSSLTNTLGLENILMASSISASRVSSSLLLSLTLRVSLCRGRERSSRVRTPWSVGEGGGITEGIRIVKWFQLVSAYTIPLSKRVFPIMSKHVDQD